jgi:DNA-binding MarR family transcriptional regulator
MTDISTPATATFGRHKYFEFLSKLYLAKKSDLQSLVLESVDQRLLEIIAVQHYLNKPLSAMQLLNSRDLLFLGASTISRKLEALTLKGWVESRTDVADRRVRFIVPTSKTLTYFEQLNALIPE